MSPRSASSQPRGRSPSSSSSPSSATSRTGRHASRSWWAGPSCWASRRCCRLSSPRPRPCSCCASSAGAAAGAYDPAARGMIVDATEEGERGEAFGIYSAFQMGGFVLGPVIGAFGAALGGGFAFPFLFTGTLTLLAAVMLQVTLPGKPRVVEEPADRAPWPRRPGQPPPAAPGRPIRAAVQRQHRGYPRRGRGCWRGACATPGPAQREPGRGAHHELRVLARVRRLRGDLEPVPPGPGGVDRMGRPDVRPLRAADDAGVAVRRTPGGPVRTDPIRHRRWPRHLHRGGGLRPQHRAPGAQRDGARSRRSPRRSSCPLSTLWLRSVHLPVVPRPLRVSSAPWAPSA